MSSRSHPRYIVVSPVKNEERYVSATIRSVLAQTVLPTRWVIVNDGSNDRTPDIISRNVEGVPWIEVINTGATERNLGVAEVRAFNAGLERVRDIEHDFVVKLDCDLELPPEYFERILEEFAQDEKLGIASGVYLEEHGGQWRVIDMPSYHAAGGSKVVRTSCFEDMGGFLCHRGWDTIDEIRARMQGWNSKHFEQIQFKHLKPEGSAMGLWKTQAFHGEIYYYTGGGALFLLAKALHRAFTTRPFLVSGLLVIAGFFKQVLARKKRAVTRQEQKFYRRLQRERLLEWLRCVFRRSLTLSRTHSEFLRR